MNNAFYFFLMKLFLFLWYWYFCADSFCYIGKQLDKKANVNFKIYYGQFIIERNQLQ